MWWRSLGQLGGGSKEEGDKEEGGRREEGGGRKDQVSEEEALEMLQVFIAWSECASVSTPQADQTVMRYVT